MIDILLQKAKKESIFFELLVFSPLKADFAIKSKILTIVMFSSVKSF